MENIEGIYQVFRDRLVMASDIKPDTRAIMILDSAELSENVPMNVVMVVFDKNSEIGRRPDLAFASSARRFVHADDYRKTIPYANVNSYIFPKETKEEVLRKLFSREFPSLARKPLAQKSNKHDAYFNAIKKSVNNHVQKRALEVIDLISEDEEFVIGKHITLVDNIYEKHSQALKEGFAEFFPIDHMSVVGSNGCFELVLTVNN